MKSLIIALLMFASFSSYAQTPTKANIENAIRSTWDRPATTSSPKQQVTINSIKIGTQAKANLQDKIDGIPEKSIVTIAQIDFIVREYYSDQTQVTHRVMTAKVYKDQFDEWAAKSNGMKLIETKSEAAH